MKLLIFTQKVDSRDDNLGFFHRWIEEFAKRCESVIVICLYEGTHNLPQNVRVLSLGKESGVSRIKYLKRFYSYIVREHKNYDAVFVHMNQIYVVLGGLLWRLLGKHVGLWYAHGAVSLSLRCAALMTNKVFTSTAEGFRIATPKRHIVGQGIDTSLFAQKDSYVIASPVRLVTVGRVMPSKNIEMMVDALAILRSSDVSATLDVVGSSDQGNKTYLATLKEYAKDKGLDEAVRFTGGVPYADLPNTLLRYDIFINVGMTGSLDKALLDAAAAGLPVISSNPASHAFLSGDGSLGACDATAQSMADAIKKVVLMSETERSALGGALRNRVAQEHALPRLVDTMLAEMK